MRSSQQIQSKRNPLVVGNWKMNGSRAEINHLIPKIIEGTADLKNIEVVVCPPFVYLETVLKKIAAADTSIEGVSANLGIGAQNCYCEKSGAFTGEISSGMLNDSGCRWVILGHSERRALFGETDALIAKKCQSAYDADLIPILCVGETLEQRKSGKTFEWIGSQIEVILKIVSLEVWNRLVVAYEPIWAIGTGITATPEEAEEVHIFLRECINKVYPNRGQSVRILYGGSVKAENAMGFFAKDNIDGALVGGASLIAEEFVNICKLCSKAKV